MWRHSRRDGDFSDEIEAHIQLEAEQLVAEGTPPDQARAAARRRFGNVAIARERYHDSRPLLWLDLLRQDVRVAMRSMLRDRGVVTIALLSLALGIGGTTAIVSMVDSVLLRPLPYREPDRIVMVWEDMTAMGFPTNTPAPANYIDWRERNRVFEAIAATAPSRANLTGSGTPERVLGRRVTASFFAVLGIQPFIGRTFTEDEERGNAPVVLIGHSLWQRRYAGDPTVVGRQLTMNDAVVTIVGVMPPSFAFRDREMEFWAPLGLSAEQWAQRGSHFLNVVARMRPGVELDTARREMRAIAADLEREHRENTRVGVSLVPIREEVFGTTRQQLIVLGVAAACLLLLMAANLANLLVARAVARRREMATRAALGAGRGRLVAQTVSEGVIWSLLGGALGVVVAVVGLEVLTAFVPVSLAETAAPQLDTRLLLIALGLSVATGVGFSVVPAIRASRVDPNDVLKSTAGGLGGGWHTRSLLITAQIAVSVALLVGAGLMMQSLANVRSVDIGFRPDGLLTANIALTTPRYDEARRRRFYEQVLEQLDGMPAIEAAGFVSTLPFTSRGNTSGYRVDGRTEAEPGDALLRVVTPGYLQALGARLIDGRLPENRDTAESLRVAVVNRTFATRHWPNESAIGRIVGLAGNRSPWMTIVGVVDDIRENGYEIPQKAGLYVLASQSGFPADNLIVRTGTTAATAAGAVREIVTRIDAEQPVAAVRSMEDIIDLEVVDRRQQSIVLGVFAGTALLLAAIGIYGLVSFSVAMRRREVGLRTALGATMSQVTQALVRHGLVLVAAGVGIGLVLSLAGTRIMEGLLFGIQPQDPLTFVTITAVVTAVSAFACWLPAWRAARLHPMAVLRQQ
jgi:predicted permease